MRGAHMESLAHGGSRRERLVFSIVTRCTVPAAQAADLLHEYQLPAKTYVSGEISILCLV